MSQRRSSSRVERPPLLTRDFLLLFISHLFFGFAFWPYVFLPIFLQDFGADLVLVGIIMGTASFAGILIRPGIGLALDGIGRRICLISGGLIFMLANLSYLWVDGIGIEIFGIRLLHGFGRGILMATFFTLAADIIPSSRRAEGIALFGVSGHLSGAIGVPLGEYLLRIGGYSLLFKACAIFATLSVLTSFYIREPRHNALSLSIRRFLQIALQRSTRVPLMTTLSFALGIASYLVFLTPYAKSVQIEFVSYFFLAYSLTAVTIRLTAGDWPDRFGLKKILYPSLISLASGIVLISFWTTPVGLIISGMLCGLGHGFIFPILSTLIINRGHDGNRGSMMTIFTLFFDIGIFIGTPFWGMIAKLYGYQTMFSLSAAIILLSLGSFLLLDKEPPVLAS
ncbi:MAG TPA: MFS transporter [Nitrospiria bacterium]|nr:MFS transporter [Candidatus Manganitrophaceae bacterium]HIL34075.1 MFS transporter [Candidatus Manganitrophaceae bacterium]